MAVLNFAPGVYSPDYFEQPAGGDTFVSGETQVYFPQLDANLDPTGSEIIQDGTTGDSTDTSSLWNTIGGIAGTFLRSFTGGQGVNIGGTVSGGPKPIASGPVQSGVSNQVLMYGAGLLILVILVVALRK